MSFSHRHPSVEAVLRFFEYKHLPDSLKPISESISHLAIAMVDRLEDDPELTEGLRKLLEAKDCFVRAAVAQENRHNRNSNDGKPV